MKKTRHEQYPSFINGLPFSLQIGIERTPSNCSAEKNWHDNPEFQLCDDGAGEVLLDGEKYSFSRGAIIAVNPNVIHYTSTDNYLKYTCLIIDTAFCRQLGLEPTAISFNSYVKSETTQNLFNELKTVYQSPDLPFRQAELYEIFIRLLLNLCKKHANTNDNKPSKPRSFENVKATIRYIRENFNQKLTLDEIAKSVYTDKFVLSRDFKRITGQTIVQYTNIYRCQKAAELIADGMGVTEAAYACAFENMSFFSKTFKRYMGKLPSKFKPR